MLTQRGLQQTTKEVFICLVVVLESRTGSIQIFSHLGPSFLVKKVLGLELEADVGLNSVSAIYLQCESRGVI